MYNTIVINLIGGPCSGKSTQAALLFALLKQKGIKVEFVSEKVKSYIFEHNEVAISNQIKLFAEELYELQNLNGKCEVIIHDGSLLTNIVYDRSNNTLFHSLVIQEYNKFNNITFFLDRGNIPFEQSGRIHNEEESRELDERIKSVHNFAGVSFNVIDSDNAAYDIIKFAASISEE